MCTRTALPPVRSASFKISSCGKARKRIEPVERSPVHTTRLSACSQAARFSVLFCAQMRMRARIAFISYLPRSEEHTSELQSRGHLVCRLLLEKKNNKEVFVTPDD